MQPSTITTQALALLRDAGAADRAGRTARILAWAALKSARGQTIRQLRLQHSPKIRKAA